MDDGKEFVVPNGVIAFYFGERGVIADRVMEASYVMLIKDGASGILRGVNFKFEWFIMVWLMKDRVCGGKSNKMIKGCGAFRCPDEGNTFL